MLPSNAKSLPAGLLGLCLVAMLLLLGSPGRAGAPSHRGIPATPQGPRIPAAVSVPSAAAPRSAQSPSMPRRPAEDLLPTPSAAVRRSPLVSERDELQEERRAAARRNGPGHLTAGEALAELLVLQRDRAIEARVDAAAPVPVDGPSPPRDTPTGRSRVVPPRPARRHPLPLAPLPVGPPLAGMPEFVVVGRTYAVDCVTPASDIPTERVRFVDYLRNVLPNEWVAAWPAQALDAGAVATKQFAWYTAVIERKWRSRGYPFDLVDSTCDQYYRDASADPRTDAALERTWGTVFQREGSVIPMFYRDTDSRCGGAPNCMGQVETAVLADAGNSHLQILARYFNTPGTARSVAGAMMPSPAPAAPPASRLPASPARATKPSGPTTARLGPSPTSAPPDVLELLPTALDQPPAASRQPAASKLRPPSPTVTSRPAAPASTWVPATPTPVPATPTPVPQMPNLVGLGLNQAKQALAKLGIYMVIVDYQGRDRLGELYDTVAPYTVVSHNPPAGGPIKAGMMVKLGVRAP